MNSNDDLLGKVNAITCLLSALCGSLPTHALRKLPAAYEREAEVARTALLHLAVADQTIEGMDRWSEMLLGRLAALISQRRDSPPDTAA